MRIRSLVAWSHTFEAYLTARGSQLRIELPIHYPSIKSLTIQRSFFEPLTRKIVIEAKAEEQHNPLEESEKPRRLA
jgi:hypothetical protein